MARKTSQVGIDLIKRFEGCKLKAYKPVAAEKYWTIGYGHYGPDVREGMTITLAQAEAMLKADLPKYEAYVNNKTFVPLTDQLTQNQFDVLVSFTYNCGAGNLKKLCAGRTLAQIAQKLPEYNKGSGMVLKGLVTRRSAEQTLFNKPDSTSVTPPKEDKPVEQARDIHKVSPWAEKDWKEAQANGYFDGSRPGAPITREETAVVVNRLRHNILELIDQIEGKGDEKLI